MSWSGGYPEAMAKNDARRQALADAGIAVLAREGSRGLTHRAVDAEAGVPVGTTSNYFRSREALVTGLFDRIGARLAPTPEDLAARADEPPSRALFAAYVRDIVRRLTTHREVTLALYELRLEAARRPDLARSLGEWQRAGLDADVAFHEAAGLPGGRREVALFHYAIEGLVLDRLVAPVDPETSTDEILDALVAGLLP
ncbi:TetR family transcriptional regulator [Cellulosimicrobium cellulans J34]|nr:TetR family transcriptional regulator [Cellulosimicrobium cellulans J34]SME88549.1 transcriptional regulator, TetR family [Cellulosimicrobium cellulans J1]